MSHGLGTVVAACFTDGTRSRVSSNAPPNSKYILRTALVLLSLAIVNPVFGAKIGDLEVTMIWEQFARFFTFQDSLVRTALLGSVFLGISCGLLGSFIVVRKLALFGDALSHAVLPGVAAGYLMAGEKNPLTIFVGASIAGVLGTVLVNLIKKTTHIKEDSSLGMVLAGFYGVGIVMMNRIQKMDAGTQSGLDKFLFGQAAALSAGDVWMMGGVALAAVALVTLFYRQFQLASFDIGFARSLRLPAGLFHYLLMLLLAFTVVVSLQAVGAVLVSAMLIIPAAAAYLITDRLHRMLILASGFGMVAGSLGAFFSFLGNSLPTGPLMVLSASGVFGACFFLSPKHGVIAKWRKHRARRTRIRNENTLKAIYHVREENRFQGEGVALSALADRMREPIREIRGWVNELESLGLGDLRKVEGEDVVLLNPEGWLHACAVVRNHRLWELYLTNQAHYEPDHVHDDAEKIEHMLGEETVRRLERLLDYPAEDPHGKLIPSLADLQRTLTRVPRKERPSGYQMPKP